MDASIPVTVIGGYLGAGTTTLVNHLLREAGSRPRDAGGRRLAVLVNDFGALPIDADLIESSDGDTISIAGGCVCCSFGSDLLAALQQLGRRDPPPDHLLIEASGVALPGAVADAVGLLQRFALDGVVVLADAETVRERAADRYLGDTILRQLAAADLVILSRIDLVDAAVLPPLLDWLRAQAPVLSATRGEVPFDLLLGIQDRTRRGDAFAPAPHAAYDSCSFDALPPLDVAQLARALAAPECGLLRAKGVLRDLDGAPVTLHLVGRRVEVHPAARGAPGRLACIGLRGRMDRPRIQRILESLTSETTT